MAEGRRLRTIQLDGVWPANADEPARRSQGPRRGPRRNSARGGRCPAPRAALWPRMRTRPQDDRRGGTALPWTPQRGDSGVAAEAAGRPRGASVAVEDAAARPQGGCRGRRSGRRRVDAAASRCKPAGPLRGRRHGECRSSMPGLPPWTLLRRRRFARGGRRAATRASLRAMPTAAACHAGRRQGRCRAACHGTARGLSLWTRL